MSPDLENIPQELRPHPNFVLWREETRNGKLTKIPVNAHTGENAAVDRPETWATFAAAIGAASQNGTKGIGFVLTKAGPYTVIDLDKCRDPETGIIEPWAQEIIDRLASYSEISPSGTGVHIWVRGKLPPGRRRKGNFEAYDSDRYLTLTGHHLEGTPLTIEPCQAELEALHGEIFGKPKGERKTAPPKSTGGTPDGAYDLTDDELIDRIRKSKNGQKFDHFMSVTDLEDLLFRYSFPSASEADFSLCTMLAFWTRKDPEQMDRIFRRSVLYREKWDEDRGGQTYGQWTIANAIAGTTEVWRGGGSKRRKSKPAQARPAGPASETAAKAGVPKIIVTNRFLNHISDEGIKALESANHPPFLFRRSGSLIRFFLDEKDPPKIIALNDVQLRGYLARHALFLKITDKGLAPTSPPMDAVKDILHLGEWPFPALEGIVQSPVLRPDGTILVDPGYDSSTHLYYIKPPDLFVPHIPENPTAQEIQEALGYLIEIICDFPFVADSDRANALGLMFTLPLRPAITGNVPMAAITAPAPGTGKGLLIDVVALLATGKVAAMAGFPRDDDEMRKAITARLLAGDHLIVFDNVEMPLWGPSLSRALTCTTWEDRILGKSATVHLPQRAVWIANGNNLKLRGDLPRRTFPIRLDAKMERPWERKDFKHDNLRVWVLRWWGDFLAAILTIGRGWFAAGKPEPKKPVPVLGGFEEWAKIIGGILSFAGVDGFLENLKQFHNEADLEGEEWGAFLTAWVEVVGHVPKTSQELAAILRDTPKFAATLPGNLQGILKDPEKSFERSLGRALAAKEKRPYGEKNLALQRVNTTRDGVILWKVAPL